MQCIDNRGALNYRSATIYTEQGLPYEGSGPRRLAVTFIYEDKIINPRVDESTGDRYYSTFGENLDFIDADLSSKIWNKVRQVSPFDF